MIVICMMNFVHVDIIMICILGIFLHQRIILIKVILHYITVYMHYKCFFRKISTQEQRTIFIFQLSKYNKDKKIPCN